MTRLILESETDIEKISDEKYKKIVLQKLNFHLGKDTFNTLIDLINKRKTQIELVIKWFCCDTEIILHNYLALSFSSKIHKVKFSTCAKKCMYGFLQLICVNPYIKVIKFKYFRIDTNKLTDLVELVSYVGKNGSQKVAFIEKNNIAMEGRAETYEKHILDIIACNNVYKLRFNTWPSYPGNKEHMIKVVYAICSSNITDLRLPHNYYIGDDVSFKILARSKVTRFSYQGQPHVKTIPSVLYMNRIEKLTLIDAFSGLDVSRISNNLIKLTYAGDGCKSIYPNNKNYDELFSKRSYDLNIKLHHNKRQKYLQACSLSMLCRDYINLHFEKEVRNDSSLALILSS